VSETNKIIIIINNNNNNKVRIFAGNQKSLSEHLNFVRRSRRLCFALDCLFVSWFDCRQCNTVLLFDVFVYVIYRSCLL